MKKAFAIVAAAALSAVAGPALAGVVMTQNIVTSSGSSSATDNRTVMIEGNKQKVVMRDQTIVLDLDAGKMILLNPATRTYTELPFPPTGQMATMMQNVGGVNLDFKKTGGTQTLSGYQCQQYNSNATSSMGQFTANGCFSSQAPGAAQYTAFTQNMAKKFADAGLAKTTGNQPDGVPIKLETSTKLTNFSIPGMSPDQAEKLKQMIASRPPTISKTTTTSIKTAEIPIDTFSIPAGYTERKVGLGGGMGGGPAPGPTPYQGE